MRYPTKVTTAVQWHEGMLLAPQHFQQATLRSEQLLAYGWRALQPYCWGVVQCQVDAMELTNGRLRITALEAVMPDGTLIQQGQADEEDLLLDLLDSIEQIKQAPQLLWLCLPMHHPELLLSDRYQSVESQGVPDLNTGVNGIEIPRLRPRLTLQLGAAPSARFTAFPLLQIAHRNENIYLEEFIAPMLQTPLHSPLNEWLTGIVVQVREKAAFIVDQVRSNSATVRSSHPALYDPVEILQGLVTPLLPLEELLHSGVSHPYPIYLHLATMAGHLAACSAIVVPPLFPAYNHNDIRGSFQPLCRFVQEILDNIQESYQVISFHFEDGRFTLFPEQEWITERFIIGLRANDRSSMRDTLAWGESCTIGSLDRVESLLLRRILGAERLSIEHEPTIGLVAPEGITLFQVNATPEFIHAEAGLCILNEQRGSFPPREILLYVKREG